MNASFCIASDHPCLKGHFPGNPVVPGVVILDHVIELFSATQPGYQVSALPMVKFNQPLLPEQDVSVKFQEKSESIINFTCSHKENTIATGQLKIKSNL